MKQLALFSILSRGGRPSKAAVLGLGTLGIVVLVILLLILVGAIPAWPHSTGWGWGPGGLVGFVLVVVIVLLVLGKI